MVGLPHWQGLRYQGGTGYCGQNAAEAVLRKKEMFIVVPAASYITATFDEPARLAELEAWRPPLALREVDPATLGPAPIGYPRGGANLATIKKYRALDP